MRCIQNYLACDDEDDMLFDLDDVGNDDGLLSGDGEEDEWEVVQ